MYQIKRDRLYFLSLILPAVLIVGVLIVCPVANRGYFGFTDASPLRRRAPDFVVLESCTYLPSDNVFHASALNAGCIVPISSALAVVMGFMMALLLHFGIKRGATVLRAPVCQIWVVPWICITLLRDWMFDTVHVPVNSLTTLTGIAEANPDLLFDATGAQWVIPAGFTWRVRHVPRGHRAGGAAIHLEGDSGGVLARRRGVLQPPAPRRRPDGAQCAAGCAASGFGALPSGNDHAAGADPGRARQCDHGPQPVLEQTGPREPGLRARLHRQDAVDGVSDVRGLAAAEIRVPQGIRQMADRPGAPANQPRTVIEQPATCTLAATPFGLPLLPIYWLAGTSFKPPEDIFAVPPQFRLERHAFDNRPAQSDPRLVRLFPNTVQASTASALLSTLAGAFCAYADSRFESRDKNALLPFFLAAMAFSVPLSMIAMYDTLPRLGPLDAHWALILGAIATGLPPSVRLMTDFIDRVPTDREEAALLGGARPFRAPFEVVLPMARPGPAASGILVFVTAWNDHGADLRLVPGTAHPARRGHADVLGRIRRRLVRVLGAARPCPVRADAGSHAERHGCGRIEATGRLRPGRRR